MALEDFNSAALKPDEYTFDLDLEVAVFYRDHPVQKQEIFFVDATALPGALCRGDEADEDHVAALLSSNPYLKDAIEDTYKTGMGGSVRYDEGYNCVILKLPRNQKNVNLLGYAAPAGIVDVFSFDHEIGHLVCPGGYEDGSPLMKECIADAYAVIRHFQRFGTEEGSIKNLTAMRTVEMILGRDEGHFTAPVVQKIIADSEKTDFSKLTPAETAACAARYAKDNAMGAQLIGYMATNFNAMGFDPVTLSGGDFSALRPLGALVMKTMLPEEREWGAIALRALLDGNIGIDGACLPKPEGAEGVKLRQIIDVCAAQTSELPKLIIAGKSSLIL